ncbi:hypothetical protein E2C01_020234 [Portunus trituberculatus]|uniref:Uncharacterized protein n=1 Tax=Portunus trituberculatus TaxID=210409 RepID=A0A5B7DZL4_PORTR|nr:hypothetical protein [Portunus trituberculatus]
MVCYNLSRGLQWAWEMRHLKMLDLLSPG